MFTDMVGFTAAAQDDEAAALRLLHEQEEIVRPLFSAHHGREIKEIGDGFLVEFESALRAAQCAIDIHQHLEERNSRPGSSPIRLRIGIHLGDVEELGGDIFGDAVNIASRIQPLAGPGGICISGPVYDQIRNKLPARFEKLEPTALKNVRVPTDIYRVPLPWETPVPSTSPVTAARLAVLPLANISPDPKDEYFADGLTEELISAFCKIHGLRVIARTSVNQYKGTTKSLTQIGGELDVGSVLEGSVRKAGNRLRITLQLIEVNSQEHVWAQSYDRELDDVFAVQTEIAEKTAAALRLELLGTARESIRKRPTDDLVAYNSYLRGIHALRQSTEEGYVRSVRFFEEAIQRDPNFSLACSYLANTLILLAGDTLAPRETFPRAKALVEKALDLDPDSSDAHTACGNLALQSDQNWELAEIEFQRAISLNPSNADAHFWYAMLLRVVQRFDEAVEELRTTIELDPLWWLPRDWLIVVDFACGDFETAIALAEEERDRSPGNPGIHIELGSIFARAGRMDEARREAELSSGPVNNHDRWNRAVLRGILGDSSEARTLLEEWREASRTRFVNLALLAGLHVVLGETEKAFECLDRDFELGDRCLWSDYQWLAFDSIRDHPRFQSKLTRLGIPVRETPVL